MKTYKIYKTLQRNAKLFGMERTIAMQYMASQGGFIALSFFLFGANTLTVLLIFMSFPLFLFIFKLRDRRNRVRNFKKTSINKKKPSTVKYHSLKIIPNEQSIIDKG
ncbi:MULTISPECIES: hypothetical protein [Flavobacteriaceae]|uniref:hypothetical protein n=1 Tax=Flavobacteriaceae TaxID=49546 RepID=UPI0010AECB18|nr:MULTISPECIES: hypothetical protein [Flavobacteriaceae]NJB38092.1 hypothetical protein [Croceivirga sp. JEA036]TKD59005.1 hypothetical protein FBT53_14570 [Flavobacterium sp. ASW18X]